MVVKVQILEEDILETQILNDMLEIYMLDILEVHILEVYKVEVHMEDILILEVHILEVQKVDMHTVYVVEEDVIMKLHMELVVMVEDIVEVHTKHMQEFDMKDNASKWAITCVLWAYGILTQQQMLNILVSGSAPSVLDGKLIYNVSGHVKVPF